MTWWIGRIEPSTWFEGPSWDALLPADVRVGVLSLGIGRIVLDPERVVRQAVEVAGRWPAAGGARGPTRDRGCAGPGRSG